VARGALPAPGVTENRIGWLWERVRQGGHSMTVRRVMGTEVEYGISVPGQPGANPMVTSSQIVNAYGARPELNRGGRARWDSEEESGVRAGRGSNHCGAASDPPSASPARSPA